jgi:putative hydrolase of the HAD superfamily
VLGAVLDLALGRVSVRRPQAILLDALGTLVALEPPAPRLMTALARADPPVQVSLEEADAAMRAEMAYYRIHLGQAVDYDTLEDLRHACTEALRRALPARARAVEGLREMLLSSLRFRAYPDAEPALKALRAAGVTLIVVSNWDVSLHDALRTTGLDRLVDGAIASAEVGSAKPDAGIFDWALGLAGDPPRDAVWHVGDSVDADVEGARAAGLRPIFIDRSADTGAAPPVLPAGVARITDLRALPATLIRAEAPAR